MKDDNFGNHYPVTDEVYRRWQGSFVGFFRNPALRAQSAYTHFVLGNRAPGPGVESQAEYASSIRGSQTTMLAGQACTHMHTCHTACYAHARAYAPSMMMLSGQAYGLSCLWLKYGCNTSITPDANKAISRLAGFAFVGLTELYDLSICLFHAMHGGPCSMVTLVGSRTVAAARLEALLRTLGAELRGRCCGASRAEGHTANNASFVAFVRPQAVPSG